ncbi:hypothetical protein JCM10213_001135 [Rhodosporidiobolus nylandii]
MGKLSQETVDSGDDSSASPKPQKKAEKKRVKAEEPGSSDEEPIAKRVKSESPVAEKKSKGKDAKTDQKKDKMEKKRSKKDATDSDSDSSPAPKDTAKVRKVGVAKRSELSLVKNDQGEQYVEIDKKRKITVREFKGKTLIDIREFYQADGEEKPGKKGISLTPQQWDRLKKSIDLIDQAIDDM